MVGDASPPAPPRPVFISVFYVAPGNIGNSKPRKVIETNDDFKINLPSSILIVFFFKFQTSYYITIISTSPKLGVLVFELSRVKAV